MAARTELTEAQMGLARELVAKGYGRTALASAIGVGASVALRVVKELRCELGIVPNYMACKKDVASRVEESISKIAEDAVRKMSSLLLALDRITRWAAPEPDLPVGIAFLADIHGGDIGVDYPAYDKDTKLILDTPGLYCVLGGDVIDNHIRYISATVAAKMSPEQQWEWLERELYRLAAKLIAIIAGNHEQWSAASTGFDAFKRLATLVCVPYDANEACIEVRLRDVLYRVAVRHKYRFNSAFNPSHSVKRYWEHGDHNFDAGVVCDKHAGTVEPFVKHRIIRWALRPSTYQVRSSFAARVGFHNALPTTPMLVLHPGERKLYGFIDLESGVTYLNAVRAAAIAKRGSNKTSKKKKRGRAARKTNP